MRRLFASVALLAASAGPLAAETILYVSAASYGRIDGYRVFADGSLSPDPQLHATTAGKRPRRLLANGCTLYVSEFDRVEVFRVGAGGRLTLVGATQRSSKVRSHDIALAEDGRTLYVPFRVTNRIASYPLGADGAPSEPPTSGPTMQGDVPVGAPTSCIYGHASSLWEDIVAANGKLYAAALNGVRAYGIEPDGRLAGAVRVPVDKDDDGTIDEDEAASPECIDYNTDRAPPEPCVEEGEERPEVTCPLSRRENMQGPTGLVVDGTSLFTGERFAKRLQGFTLQDDGNFPPIYADPLNPTKKERKAERKSRKKNRTPGVLNYIGLTFFKPADAKAIIFAVGAFRGRVDDFRLRDDGTLPKSITTSSALDVVATPTRLTIRPAEGSRNAVMYLATGELDRVRGFRLDGAGALFSGQKAFTETNETRNAYPNDVLLLDVDACS